MKNKAIIGVITIMGSATSLLANADAAALAEPKQTFFTTENIVATLFGLFLIYAIYQLSNIFIKLREIRVYKKYGVQQYLKERNQSWFQRLKRTATNAVPISKEEDIIFHHSYDGIRELDNDLPPWWLWMFYITIVMGVAYFGYYHVLGLGLSSTEQYEQEMALAKQQVEDYISKQSNLVDENNVTELTDEASLTKGKEIFVELCAACHLETGAGTVGPNLTDDYFLYGNTIADVFKTVKYGVPEKGMISWKTQISPADMHKVSSYLLTLVGTNPPNPKEPQGEFIARGSSAPIQNDSLSTPTPTDTLEVIEKDSAQ